MINSVSVVIPTYMGKDKLEKCLEKIKGLIPKDKIEIVDNNIDNRYFTKSINLLLKKATTKYVLALNQDCYINDGAVEKMVAFMDKNPKCGMCAPLQVDVSGENVLCGGTLECFPAGRHIGGNISLFKENSRQNWLNGACLLIRMDMVKEIGLMDENMVFTYSDSDYSYRARVAEWELWVVAEATVNHEHGESSNPSKQIEKVSRGDFVYFRDKWITGELFRDLSLEVY